MDPLTAPKQQCKICNQVFDPGKKNSWGYNILLSIDQFGNAVANGNPDSTISARVGYFANDGLSNSKYPGYWKFMENMINIAWWPFERNHCKNAYDADPEYSYAGNGLAKIALFILALAFSIIISILSYTAWLISPTLRNRTICSECGQPIKESTSQSQSTSLA